MNEWEEHEVEIQYLTTWLRDKVIEQYRRLGIIHHFDPNYNVLEYIQEGH